MNKRIMAILMALIMFAVSLAACGEEPNDSQTESKTETEPAIVTESETEPATQESELSNEDVPAIRPVADGGELHYAYDLSYCLPDWMEPMKYNGMMGVYEYYTGTFNGSPTGLDFACEVYSDEELNGETLETYIQTRSRAAKAGLTAIEKVSYNGFEWLRLANGSTATYYYAVFNEGLYCLLTLQGADSSENYLVARDMMEKTLFFATED